MKQFTRLAALAAVTFAFSWLSVGNAPAWPGRTARQAIHRFWSSHTGQVTPVDDEADVKTLPVCIASPSWSSGDLGESVLYRYQREGRTLKVGYFVYWSNERPWGKNVLSYAFLPAFFIDAFYSHLFFLLPGAQRFIHGPGDIEGARVTYEQQADGRWKPVSAVADDGVHREVALSPNEFVDRDGRVVLRTDVWSHQLGAKGARSYSENQSGPVRCFEGDALAPLTEEVARVFRLGSPSDPRRAPPAWRLDMPAAESAANAPLEANMFGAIGRVSTMGR